MQALLGKTRCLEKKGQYSAAVEVINEVVVRHPWFLLALNQKARLLIALGSWEPAMEACKRLLLSDNLNIDALFLSGEPHWVQCHPMPFVSGYTFCNRSRGIYCQAPRLSA